MRESSGKGEFTGRHMLIIMLCFFGAIIAVNLIMAYIAGNSWTGLVVKSSFVASQEFNGNLEKAKAQKALGWTSDVTYQNAAFTLALKDRNGKPIAIDSATFKIGRPTFEQKDHMLELRAGAAFKHTAGDDLQPGLWDIQVQAEAAGIAYQRNLRILITPDGRGILQ